MLLETEYNLKAQLFWHLSYTAMFIESNIADKQLLSI